MKPPPRRNPGSSGPHRPGGQGGGRRDTRRDLLARRKTTTSHYFKGVRRALPGEILRRIDSDPLFAVMTSDQQQWIDPYSGTPVPASLGRAQAAREYLLETNAWKDKEPLPRTALETIRWRLELMRLLPIDPRLRIFNRDGHGWLNPFNGELIAEIAKEDGKITVRTVMAMARALAGCPQAQLGRLLDNQTLMGRVQALGLSQAKGGGGAPSASGIFKGGSTPPEMNEDMSRAKSVQEHMLADLPAIDGYQLAVHYSAHSGVSGDFYEVVTLADGRVLIVLGDVSGHGMQAALVVATALKTLRFLARDAYDLVQLLTRFNDEIKADLLPGQFITLFAAMLDPDTARITCVRAGHHAALIANLDGPAVLRKFGSQGIAIGLVAGPMFAKSLHPEIIDLNPGDVVLQYTDGLTEAVDAESVEYGDGRLYGSFLKHVDLPTQELVDAIAKEVGEYARGDLGDDLTIFALSVFEPEADAEGEAGAEGEGDDQDAADADAGDEPT